MTALEHAQDSGSLSNLNWAIVTETMQTITDCSHLTGEQSQRRAAVDYVLTAHRITNFSFSSKDCQGFAYLPHSTRGRKWVSAAGSNATPMNAQPKACCFWGGPTYCCCCVSTASAIKDALATSQPAESDRLGHGTLTDTYQSGIGIGKIAIPRVHGRVRVVSNLITPSALLGIYWTRFHGFHRSRDAALFWLYFSHFFLSLTS